MAWTPILMALLAVGLVVLAERRVVQYIGSDRRMGSGPPGFRKTRSVLSPGEQAAHDLLRRAVGDEWVVMPKLPVSSLLRTGDLGGRNARLWNSIKDRYADFVLAAPDTLEPVAVVMIQTSDTSVREGAVELPEVCAAAGLPLIRLSPARKWGPEALSDHIQQLVARTGA